MLKYFLWRASAAVSAAVSDAASAAASDATCTAASDAASTATSAAACAAVTTAASVAALPCRLYLKYAITKLTCGTNALFGFYVVTFCHCTMIHSEKVVMTTFSLFLCALTNCNKTESVTSDPFFLWSSLI
jgi:hypothetical protein